jgi:predicted 3-demethylubiquinone-9 3-methyltransferase (glyoxalase superfamily)
MLGDKDQQKAGRAMKAMMQMKKLDIKVLKQAFDSK